jgi:AcrR family transcriptional regulator
LKIWSDDNPKAALMERKRAAIVAAARQVFLENGYAQASMDRIAESAAVSVKTIYRHFENKDELFSAVMQAMSGRQFHSRGARRRRVTRCEICLV